MNFILGIIMLGASAFSQESSPTIFKFEAAEAQFQNWDNLNKTSPEKASESYPEVQAAFELKQQLFHEINPKIDFQKKLKEKIEHDEKYKILGSQLEEFTIVGFGMMSLIALLPESISQWNTAEIQNTRLSDVYIKNIKSGPVVDQDSWALNFIGHPISGAAYYLLARHSGFNWSESMTFSILMSTFFWEYGLEAVIEKPSIQDLIITPLMGSVIGELFYQAEREIILNHGKVLESKPLGTVARAFLNPAGSLIRVFKSDQPLETPGSHKIGYFAEIKNFNPSEPRNSQLIQLYYGIRLRLWF